MFVRFVTSKIGVYSHVEEGIFGLAYAMRDGDQVFDYERNVLADVLHWFDEHLSAPTRFSRNPLGSSRAICWFRSSAEEHIRKIYEMIAIIENHFFDVRMIKTQFPGYVVYQDRYQVAAEPFADTRRKW